MHNAEVKKFQTGSRLYIKTIQKLAFISDEVWITLNTNINNQISTGSCISFYTTKSVWCAVSMHKIIRFKLAQEKHSGHYVQLIFAPYFMELKEGNVQQSTFFIRTERENVGTSR